MNRLPALSSEMISELAHELRSPLGGIDAMVEMLAATPLSAEQERLIFALKASAAHLRAVSDRALGAAAQDGPEQPRALGAILDPLVASGLARAEAKRLAFGFLADDSLRAELVPEPTALRQVIENLVDNAMRVTPRGTVLLALEKIGGRLAIRVEDEGPGLAEAEAERLIRQGGAVPGRPGGAGLGLSICGRLVSRQGGQLEGRPHPRGNGSVFSFDWPLGERDGSGIPCLIVDDHPASRLILRTILRSLGFSCLEAENLGDARTLLTRGTPRLVVTDLRLGDEDGRVLIRDLATRAPEWRPKIVVVSADPIERGTDCYAMIDAMVMKPISVRAIAEAMAQIGFGTQTRAA